MTTGLLRFLLICSGILAATLVASPVGAQSPRAVPLPADGKPVLLGRHLEILEDPRRTLTLEDVQSSSVAAKFSPSNDVIVNPGFTRSAFWLRFQPPVESVADRELLLEIRFPVLDHIEAYLPETGPDGRVEYRRVLAGDTYPWPTRELKHRNLVFRLSTNALAREHTVFLRVFSDGPVSVPAYLWQSEAFASHERNAQLMFGLFFGLVLALLLYNLMVYVAIRDSSYLYYVLYAASAGIYFFSLDGFAFEYLWPSSIWMANQGATLFYLAGIGFGAQFIRSFLNTPRVATMSDRGIIAIEVAALLLAIGLATGWISFRFALQAAGALTVAACALAVLVATRALLAGSRSARFFLLAWLMLLLSLPATALRMFGIIPYNNFSAYGIHIGLALDLLLLSLALGDRINAMRREAHTARTEARAMEIASRHKSEFLANMSHELRTPLNAILGFSEILKERYFGDLNPKQAEYVNDIYSSGAHLLSLINDILDLSKVEAGKMVLEPAEFDLPAALQNSIALIKERAQRHGIRLELTVDPALGSLRADERKFKQIMLNLLSNAVKFTPDGGAVTVQARPLGNQVEISVTDTGAGIAPEDHTSVFEEFKQVGRDSARKAEGTGLGLPLTKRFVELHGGTIRLESATGEGSTFSFTLPSSNGPGT